MASFSPIIYNPKQLRLRLYKPWRARGKWGGKDFVLGWFETRKEAEEEERRWREGVSQPTGT